MRLLVIDGNSIQGNGQKLPRKPSQSPAVTALPKGEPLAKPKALPYCQSLSPRERRHGASRDGEGMFPRRGT